MIDSCASPLTSTAKAATLCLLITLLSLLLGAAVAEGNRTSSVSVRVDQLSNAFKLLQLQLKQTTETAEHVQSLLADLAQREGDAASAQDQPGEAAVWQEQQQKKHQEYEQTRAPTNMDAHHDAIVVQKHNSFSRTLAQRATNWADDFLMLSFFKADTAVTAMAVLTYQPGGLQNQYLLLADTTGKMYAFNVRGQLTLEHDIGCLVGGASAGTPIQSVTAAVKSQDQAIIVAGLANGTSLVVHVALANRHTHLQHQLLKEHVQLLPPPDPPARPVGSLTASSRSSSMTTDECDSGLLQSATGVTHVGLLRAGAARHVIAALADGQVLMYRENGTIGAAGQSNETIKALHTVGSSISMLTTQHLVSARVFGGELRLKLRQLAGLNESVIAAAVFDGQNQYRAYAVTTDMQLLLLQVSDQGRRAVRVMSRVPLSLAPTVGPVHLTHARGYLFLAAPTGVAVFNTTGFDNRRGPKMVLAHPYSNVASDLAPDGMFAEKQVLPPVAAAQGPLVAVSLGDGAVGLFESKMPFKEPDLLPLHAMSRPLAILAMIVVGGWQFVRTKRRQEAQHMGKGKSWPPDWGPGDASRFVDFPELPKSRTQLVPPEKAQHMRAISDAAAVGPRLPARMEGPQQDKSSELLLQDANDMSSADLDALMCRQRAYERPKGGQVKQITP